MAERFEDMVVWQRAKSLTVNIYRIFRETRDFGFKNQIERAAVSIMNNIAEGFERKGDKEFRQFLYIAKGSSGEVRSMLLLAKDLEYLSSDQFGSLFQASEEISKMLAGLIRTLGL